MIKVEQDHSYLDFLKDDRVVAVAERDWAAGKVTITYWASTEITRKQIEAILAEYWPTLHVIFDPVKPGGATQPLGSLP